MPVMLRKQWKCTDAKSYVEYEYHKTLVIENY